MNALQCEWRWRRVRGAGSLACCLASANRIRAGVRRGAAPTPQNLPPRCTTPVGGRRLPGVREAPRTRAARIQRGHTVHTKGTRRGAAPKRQQASSKGHTVVRLQLRQRPKRARKLLQKAKRAPKTAAPKSHGGASKSKGRLQRAKVRHPNSQGGRLKRASRAGWRTDHRFGFLLPRRGGLQTVQLEGFARRACPRRNGSPVGGCAQKRF